MFPVVVELKSELLDLLSPEADERIHRQGRSRQRKTKFITVKVTKLSAWERGPEKDPCGSSLVLRFIFCPLLALSKKHQPISFYPHFPLLGSRGEGSSMVDWYILRILLIS